MNNMVRFVVYLVDNQHSSLDCIFDWERKITNDKK